MENLERAFRFNQRDLEINQRGGVTSRQLLRMVWAMVLRLAVMFVISLIAGYILLRFGPHREELRNLLILFIGGLAIPGLLLLVNGIYLLRLVIAWFTREVGIESGNFSLNTEGRWLYLDERNFPISRRQHRTLKQFAGKKLAVYYLKWANRIISIEELSDASSVGETNANRLIRIQSF